MSTQEAPFVEEMFVQVAHGASASPGTLTLKGVNPSTLYFSDRPERVVGHMTTGEFVADWATGPNSFAEDPPTPCSHLSSLRRMRRPTSSSSCATRS